MSIAEPAKIITPWANTGSKNPIPQNANNTTGEAGYDKGFPDITMTPPEAGGIPPAGQDFNGILFEITSIIRYIQAGGQPSFSSALATAIGGYPSGALVLGSDGVTIWQSQVGSNMDNPDVTPTNWKKVDVNLRQALAAAGGVSLVSGANYRFGTAAEMATQTVFTPRDGDVCTTSGYHTQADGGGATYTYASASAATVDGFLVHNCAAGGRWLLVDNRSRLPMQVAGAKVDGTTDDRAAFLAVLASNRCVVLDGIMRISGAAIDLSAYVTAQELSFEIQGSGPIGSQLLFDSGSGGLYASGFFRGSSLSNINIKNGTLDMTGVGFINPNGAEMLDWVNVTFTGWRAGPLVHAWNSTLVNVASRACYYAGAVYGTSQKNGSFYAVRCNYAWAFGLAYSGGLSGTMTLPAGGLAMSYGEMGAFAADECGPYMIGRCFNLKITSMGAERGIGPYLVDLSLYSPATARQNVAIECFDAYVQSADGVTAVFGPITNAYGSLKIENTNIFSDKNIPLFSGDGRGIRTRNVQYNSSSAKKFTDSVTNGMVITDELILGSDYAQLQKVGYSQGGYDQIRKVRAMMSMPISAGAKLVIRIQDTSVTGLAQGVCVSGELNLYPVHKSAVNAGRECGKAIFSVAADFAGGLTSINLQKLGSLGSLTASNRVTGTVQELVLTFPTTVQYFAEVSFWCNGKFAAGNAVDYYVEP